MADTWQWFWGFLTIAALAVAIAAICWVAAGGSGRRRGPTGPTGGVDILIEGQQFNDIQILTKAVAYQSFLLGQLYNEVSTGVAVPTGRTITIQNQTSATTLDIYLTQGFPTPIAPTIISGATGLAPSGSLIWDIPITQGWNGNFAAMPHGSPIVSGVTLAEFGLNQLWSGATPPLRDTFDISTVPPGIGNQANNGPRATVVQLSRNSGYSVQQSYGYNVGISIVPPVGSLPTQTVTCVAPDGNSAEAITFPNDTATPKQQTGQALGDYTLNFLDPVIPTPSNP